MWREVNSDNTRTIAEIGKQPPDSGIKAIMQLAVVQHVSPSPSSHNAVKSRCRALSGSFHILRISSN
ncbi:MAG: hypothetical protein OXB95_04245, partial [Rhodobacteraceae bacterium]|nr:hypothetical protein [Paracoccaceae bacterium]